MAKNRCDQPKNDVQNQGKIYSKSGETEIESPYHFSRFYFSVVGTPFYLMDYVRGRIFSDAVPKGVNPDEMKAIYGSLNEVLQKIHSVDITKAGLDDYGKQGKGSI